MTHEAMPQRVRALEEALEPFALLETPPNPEGNAGFYSLRFSDIDRARKAYANDRPQFLATEDGEFNGNSHDEDDPLRDAAEAVVNRWAGGEPMDDDMRTLRDALGWEDAP